MNLQKQNVIILDGFSYEDLLKEEKTTLIELTAMEKKIEASFINPPERSFKAPSGKALSGGILSSQLPEEVVAFEKFLQQTGGRLGGWDDYDHQSFLKVWTKHKCKPGYLEEALAYLPSRTREDIQLHEAWYQELLFLEEKKKEVSNILLFIKFCYFILLYSVCCMFKVCFMINRVLY